MNARTLLYCAAGLVLCAHVAWCAEGAYQQTKDGKTKVWNGDPQPGDLATWSGGRDENGYASGYGTLAWYSLKEPGSEQRSGKPKIFARYTGRLMHGKLDGMITAEAKGVLSHATFADGRKVSHWVAGRAPAREQDAAESIAANASKPKTHRSAAKRETRSEVVDETAQKPTTGTEPPSPAEAPVRSVETAKPLSTPPPVVAETPRPSSPPIVTSTPRPTPPPVVVAPKPSPSASSAPAAAASPSNTKKLKDVDESLRNLVGPPSSLLPDRESPAPEAGSSPAKTPSASESPSPAE